MTDMWVLVAVCYLTYMIGLFTGYHTAKRRAVPPSIWGREISHVRPKTRPFDYDKDA